MFGLTSDEIAIALWRMKNGLIEADAELMKFLALPAQRADWLRFARRSLLFSSGQAGQRLGVTRAAFLRLEKRESTGQVTLAKLREATEAIGCELVYAVRPKNRLTFAEASWLRLAMDAEEAKAPRRSSPPGIPEAESTSQPSQMDRGERARGDDHPEGETENKGL